MAVLLGVKGIKRRGGGGKGAKPPRQEADLPKRGKKGSNDDYDTMVDASRKSHSAVPKKEWDRARKLYAQRVTSKGTKKRMDPAWVSTWTNDTSKNADRLRRNLGGQVNDGMRAHHIVRGGGQDAEAARKLLADYQIDVNSADNGVLIPASFHQSGKLHDSRVTAVILRRLESTTRSRGSGRVDKIKIRNALIDELTSIGAEIIDGQFP